MALLAFQHQLNSLFHSVMFQLAQQVQMGTLQPTVHYPQQKTVDVVSTSSLSFTSVSPVFSSVNITHSVSQTLTPTYSHTPKTAEQQQNLLCDNSTKETSTSSQVCMILLII